MQKERGVIQPSTLFEASLYMHQSVRTSPVTVLAQDFEKAAFHAQNFMQGRHIIEHWQGASQSDNFNLLNLSGAKEGLGPPDGTCLQL